MRGVLFFAGFFSKHAIFSQVLSTRSIWVFFLVIVVGRRITCLYSVRLASSVMKLGKFALATPQQVGLLACSLVGGAIISKLLVFEVEFSPRVFGGLSFLFLFWL